jgi:phospholipid/cholesterol/gamma-HCH transport system substrate-binding protein
MSAVRAKENKPRATPRKRAGSVAVVVIAFVLALAWNQFRGGFTPSITLTMLAYRAGLVMDPGSKVTYNGVEIGRVASVDEVAHDGKPMAKISLNVNPHYLDLIPANVNAVIEATTVFGNKYVSLSTPKNAAPQAIRPNQVIDATSVTTEFNTLFETVTSISEKVDPVKLNATLTAAAQALDGLGTQFGQSLLNADDILADLIPRIPQIGYDAGRFADLADVYTKASPDLWAFLNNAVTTAHTLNEQQHNLDAALLAAAGIGNTGADIFTRAKPYFVRASADLLPTARLLDEYSPELFCTLRNLHDVAITAAAALGGNGISLYGGGEIVGGINPYVYPDNLPRINAKGGPGGKPGCWKPITRDLWPAPYLVQDTGASLAPYNHFEIGSPYATEYVWGRQIGENTINP